MGSADGFSSCSCVHLISNTTMLESWKRVSFSCVFREAGSPAIAKAEGTLRRRLSLTSFGEI